MAHRVAVPQQKSVECCGFGGNVLARYTSGWRGESCEGRCGGRGLRVFAVRIPAASDLVGIYEDVGAVLMTLGTSSVPSFRFATSVSDGAAISAIRTPPAIISSN